MTDSLFSSPVQRFDVDATTGVITVAFCDTPGHRNCLDYEERPTYFLSFQVCLGYDSEVIFQLTKADRWSKDYESPINADKNLKDS